MPAAPPSIKRVRAGQTNSKVPLPPAYQREADQVKRNQKIADPGGLNHKAGRK